MHNDHVPVSIISTTQNIFIQPTHPVKPPRFARFGGAAPFSHSTATPELFLDRENGVFPVPATPGPDLGEFPVAPIMEYKKSKSTTPSWAQNSPKKDKGYVVKMGAAAVAPNQKRIPPVKKTTSEKQPPPQPKNRSGPKKTSEKRSQSNAPPLKPKSEFVSYVYPTGTGPDVELIEMLEHDMVPIFGSRAAIHTIFSTPKT